MGVVAGDFIQIDSDVREVASVSGSTITLTADLSSVPEEDDVVYHVTPNAFAHPDTGVGGYTFVQLQRGSDEHHWLQVAYYASGANIYRRTRTHTEAWGSWNHITGSVGLGSSPAVWTASQNLGEQNHFYSTSLDAPTSGLYYIHVQNSLGTHQVGALFDWTIIRTNTATVSRTDLSATGSGTNILGHPGMRTTNGAIVGIGVDTNGKISVASSLESSVRKLSMYPLIAT